MEMMEAAVLIFELTEIYFCCDVE